MERLDSIEDPASEPTLQVYKVRNGDAGQLAELLSTIYGGSGGGSVAAGGVAPGLHKPKRRSVRWIRAPDEFRA